MPERKCLDERSFTRGGGVIRVEAWIDAWSDRIHRYNLAYVNFEIYSGDNGRVVGFDNRHRCPGSDRLITRIGLGLLRKTGASSLLTRRLRDLNVYSPV